MLLLEGRDRLGGRTYTHPFAGTEVELGGMSVHWFQPHVFAEMTRYDVPFEVPPEPTRWSYRSQGRVHERSVSEVLERLGSLFERVFPDARATLPLPHQPLVEADAITALDDLSVQDRIDASGLDAEERDLVNAVLATACSAPCSSSALTAMMRWFALSGWSFGLMLDAVGAYSIRTADLVDALVADAQPDVRLSTAVAAVAQEDERVTVTSRSGATFSAEAAVLAVPLNTLAGIRCFPALGVAQRRAAARGQVSRGVKLWAHVRGEVEPFFHMAPDDHDITFLETARVLDDGTHLLCAFSPDGERLPPDDDGAVRQAFTDVLPPGCEVDEVIGHSWVSDPYSRGTWSVYRPGQLSSGLAALRAPHGRIAFAGSDLAEGWNGFMDGAIETGLRAGRLVGRLLRAPRPLAAGSL